MSDPLLARLYPHGVAAVMVELWQARRRICAILASWPQVFGHLDATPANVIVRGGQAYLIDWAFAGQIVPGEELAPLVAGSGLFGGLPAGHLPAIDRVAFPAYLDGPDAAGWVGDPAHVRFAYCAAAALASASRRLRGWSAASTRTAPAQMWAGCATPGSAPCSRPSSAARLPRSSRSRRRASAF